MGDFDQDMVDLEKLSACYDVNLKFQQRRDASGVQLRFNYDQGQNGSLREGSPDAYAFKSKAPTVRMANASEWVRIADWENDVDALAALQTKDAIGVIALRDDECHAGVHSDEFVMNNPDCQVGKEVMD